MWCWNQEMTVFPVFLQSIVQSTAHRHPLKIRTLIDYVEVQMASHVVGAEETIILHLPQILILRYVIANTRVNRRMSSYTVVLCTYNVTGSDQGVQRLLLLLSSPC